MRTYSAKLDKKINKVGKEKQVAKKGTLEWYKEKYGALKGEEQYHLQKAIEANLKLKQQSKTITKVENISKNTINKSKKQTSKNTNRGNNSKASKKL